MAVLTFAKDETSKLHALIAPFVHPSMAYKLLPKYQGRFGVEPVFAEPKDALVPMPITSIRNVAAGRASHRFDIEVEGNHNYFVDGVMVHNSPETTPGGRALKFYCSCRIDVRRIGQLKDGEEVVGQRVRCKVVKNKVAPPFRIAEFDMMHSNGISYEGDLLDVGAAQRVVSRSGAWFKLGDVYLGQGKEKARAFLKENPAMTAELREKILSAGALTGGVASAEANSETETDS